MARLGILAVMASAMLSAIVPSASGAAAWSAPQRLSDNAGLPQLAVAPSGEAVAVWLGDGGPRGSFRRAGQGRWSRSELLVTPRHKLDRLRLAIAPEGAAVAVWESIPRGGVPPTVQIAARPSGDSWHRGRDLVVMGQGARWPEVAFGPDGSLFASWWRSGLIFAAVRRPGQGWSAPQQLSQSPDFGEVTPRIAVGPAGDAVVWWSLTGQQALLQAAYRPGVADGWLGAEAVSDPGISPSGALMTVDRQGNVLAIFSGSAAVRPAGATWHPLGTSGQLASTDLAVDAAGAAVTVWLGSSGLRLIAQVAALEPGGSAWSPGRRLSSPSRNASMPGLGLSASGHASVVWQQRIGPSILTWAAHRRSRTAPWSSPRRIDSMTRRGAPLQLEGQQPSVAVDGVGRATALWEECRWAVVRGGPVPRCSVWIAQGAAP